MKTLEECEALAEKSKKFIKKTTILDGHEVISFNYQDGTHYEDFLEHDGFHMRGLTFVDGEKFPMLDKFFNLGEIHPNEIEEAKQKKIKSIQKKDDGALIGFIILPNGRVLSKTKAGLNNEYTDIANKWLLEEDNEEEVKSLFEQGVFPLFECVSNQLPIVLKYEWEGLILIQARRKDLSFLEIAELQSLAIKNNWVFEDPLEYTLEELLHIKDNIEDIEGFIVRFDDDSFTKIKTTWYFENHAKSEALDRMNILINSIFKNEDIDMENYEKEFIKNLNEKFLDTFQISSLDMLKAWIFKEGDKKDVNKYKMLYKGFLKEYALENNYENENTIIKLTLENSIDDIVPSMEKSLKEKVLDIQENVNKHFFDNVQKITEALERKIDPKQILEEYPKYDYLGLIFKLSRTEWDNDTVSELLKKDILKKTKNKKAAIKFIEDCR